jgi:hypothetical protein
MVERRVWNTRVGHLGIALYEEFHSLYYLNSVIATEQQFNDFKWKLVAWRRYRALVCRPARSFSTGIYSLDTKAVLCCTWMAIWFVCSACCCHVGANITQILAESSSTQIAPPLTSATREITQTIKKWALFYLVMDILIKFSKCFVLFFISMRTLIWTVWNRPTS